MQITDIKRKKPEQNNKMPTLSERYSCFIILYRHMDNNLEMIIMRSKRRGRCFSHSPHIWLTFSCFLFDSVLNHCVEDGFTIIKKGLVTANIFSAFPNILPA